MSLLITAYSDSGFSASSVVPWSMTACQQRIDATKVGLFPVMHKYEGIANHFKTAFQIMKSWMKEA